ncbi:MAG: Hpt domain-containing protein, partial [Sedimenticola sp.]
MAIGMDDEILQDFLAEAGDILEQLNEQLVDLEQDPGNYDLLNAVFRGFHTIKGGAGFLNIEAMVTVCHRAEDVFNVLRRGQRRIDPSLMDVVLQALDLVNEMFAVVKAGAEPEHVPAELLEKLAVLSQPDEEVVADEPQPMDQTPEPITAVATGESDGEAAADVPAEAESDEISEDEFEALLDQLHGVGKHGGVPAASVEANTKPPPAKKKRAPRAKAKAKTKAKSTTKSRPTAKAKPAP